MSSLSFLIVILCCGCSHAAVSQVRVTGSEETKGTLPLHSNSHVSTNPACQTEIARICETKPEYLTDLDALECILNKKRNEVDEISNECNHVLWHFRKNLTEQNGFLNYADKQCGDDFRKTGCFDTPSGVDIKTNNLPCIIDNKDKIERLGCQNLITRLEGVVFGDYDMIEKFANDCQEDINKFKCGRNDLGGTVLKQLPHSQGKTIECLSKEIEQLTPKCSKQIFRVAELQSDDFHLDRALYFACRGDREKFCSRVVSGNGRVYKCLLHHKLEQDMTTDCRDQLYRRQKLGWQDYKASGIVSSCKDEIKKYKCRRGVSSSDKHVRLSQILLCLENEFHKGQDIPGDCLNEIHLHRKTLLDDFSLTPELLSACNEDKEKYCKEKGIHGKTFHCLMAHAQSRKEKLSEGCKIQVENLLKISDISSDWQMDPVLQKSCQKVVAGACSTQDTARVLDCLMNLLTAESGSEASSLMDEDCESTLIQIQYFMARDFSLDSSLFELCNEDAHKICAASPDWANVDNNVNAGGGGGGGGYSLVLSCLYRNIKEKEISEHVVSPKCAAKVRDTMRQRAVSVRLLPEIEETCMNDLADLCSEKTKAGEELQCLQAHLEDLSKSCRRAVSNFTDLEMDDPSLDPYIWKHCRSLIETKCGGDKSDEDYDLLNCLIGLKPEIKNKKCKVSVEHLQILRLKEVRFTPKFKTQCQMDVMRYCNGKDMQPLTSWKVVDCLSEAIRNDIITENTLRVSKGCRKQVRGLLLVKLQLENGVSDAKSIYKLCKKQIQEFCGDVKPGNGQILECLRDNSMRIQTNSDCHEALFRVEQEVDTDQNLDLIMKSECGMEIKIFCSNQQDEQQQNILQCLKLSSKREGFGERCAKIVQRRIIEQNSDLRLNTRLHKACGVEIETFCKTVSPGQGRIIGCLKKIFVNPSNSLGPPCKEYLDDVLKSAAEDGIRIDPDLYFSCKKDIEKSCPQSVGESTEECLKQLYKEMKLMESGCRDRVILLIQTTMIDIHVDPLLYRACSLDLVRHCARVPPGDARLLKCLFIKLREEQEQDREEGPPKNLFSEKCQTLLTKRGELFQLVGEAAGGNPRMDSLIDLVDRVQHSPQRNFFFSAAFSIVGVIFIFGLFCGRATKRAATEKNK